MQKLKYQFTVLILISLLNVNAFADSFDGSWLIITKCHFPESKEYDCSISLRNVSNSCYGNMTYLNNNGVAKNMNINCSMKNDMLQVSSRNYINGEYNTFLNETITGDSIFTLSTPSTPLIPNIDFNFFDGQFKIPQKNYNCYIAKNEMNQWKSMLVSDKGRCSAIKKAFWKIRHSNTDKKIRFLNVISSHRSDSENSYDVYIGYNSPLKNSAIWEIRVSESLDGTTEVEHTTRLF